MTEFGMQPVFDSGDTRKTPFEMTLGKSRGERPADKSEDTGESEQRNLGDAALRPLDTGYSQRHGNPVESFEDPEGLSFSA